MSQVQKWVHNNATFIAWTLSSLVSFLALLVWLQSIDWDYSEITFYTTFPLLGIIAFSLMWTHYIVYALRIFAGFDAQDTKQYFDTTSTVVLGAMLLHPGMLIAQLYIDGYGLPPSSYTGYVAQASLGFVYMGVVSLVIFLLFELKDRYNKKSWWKLVSAANVIAMLLIFWHARELGSLVGGGWFQLVWVFYGATLLGSYVYLAYKRKLI